MMVKVKPITAPPPMPCRPRKRINWFMPSSGSGMLPAAPHSHDETTKMINASEVEPLPAVEVGKLGEHRDRDGRGEQVGGGHPRVAVEAVEAGDDARHGGADDGLVHRRQQQREHQAAEGRGALAGVEVGVAGHLTPDGQGSRRRGGWHQGDPGIISRSRRRSGPRLTGRARAVRAANGGRAVAPAPGGPYNQWFRQMARSVRAPGGPPAGRSFNGRTPRSGRGYRGSNPCLPATSLATLVRGCSAGHGRHAATRRLVASGTESLPPQPITLQHPKSFHRSELPSVPAEPFRIVIV